MVTREALAELDNRWGTSLFARGFLVSQSEPAFVPSAWRRSTIDKSLVLFHDPRTPVHESHRRGAHLIVVGHLYSVTHPSDSGVEVAQRLVGALSKSRPAFYRALDHTHGRFVLLYRRSPSDGLRITTDATGMRASYYHRRARCAASHPALLAVNTGARERPLDVKGYGTPGRLTPYEDVVLLPPNQELDYESGRMIRYWPRRKHLPRTSKRAGERASKYMAQTLSGIVHRHGEVLASLTAGTDSRATLAVVLRAQAVSNARFFTYFWNNNKWIDRADKRIAQEIANDYGLRYETLPLNELEPSPSGYEDLLRANAFLEHFSTLAHAYASTFDPDTTVHLRSNLSEIGRAFYLRRGLKRPRSAKAIADIYWQSIRVKDKPTPEVWDTVVEAFREFYQATDFARGARLVDGRDLFYWEHRMGTWHSQVVLESDVAFESLSLYNSRVVLETLMGVTLRARLEDRSLKRIIEGGDPELLAIPFNPGPKKYKKVPPPTHTQVLLARVTRVKSTIRSSAARFPGARRAYRLVRQVRRSVSRSPWRR